MKNVQSLVLLLGIVSWVSGSQEVNVQFVNLNEIAPTNSRIVSGTWVDIELYPFTVQIIAGGTLVCGGTLITVQNILSAARCFFERTQVISTDDLNVRAGTTDNNSGGTIIPVLRLVVHERYIVHEGYYNPLRDNDIAVLRTSSQFTLGPKIGLAYIPYQDDDVLDDTPLVKLGWGTMSVTGTQMSSVLRQVVLLKVNRTVCIERYELLVDTYNITDNMMCAGMLDYEVPAGACRGDSGGPVHFVHDIVVGIVSWGHECGHPRIPGVFMRVARYSDWLNTTVTYINGSSSVSESRIVLLFTLICAMLHWQSR